MYNFNYMLFACSDNPPKMPEGEHCRFLAPMFTEKNDTW